MVLRAKVTRSHENEPNRSYGDEMRIFKCQNLSVAEHAFLIKIFKFIVWIVFRFEGLIFITAKNLADLLSGIKALRIQRLDTAQFRNLFLNEAIKVTRWLGLLRPDAIPKPEIDIKRILSHRKEGIRSATSIMAGRTDPNRANTDFLIKKLEKLRRIFNGDVNILNDRFAMNAR